MEPIHPSQKKTVVARVNGTVITEYQVASALQTMLDPYKDTRGKVRLPQQEIYAARKQAINNLIMRELLYQEGCRTGIAATDEEIATVTKGSIAEFDSQQHFQAMLVMTGQTPAEFDEQIKKDIIINKTAAAAIAGKKKPVTRQEARQYYDEHSEEMQGPEVRRLLQVMRKLDRYADPAEEKKARQELEKLAADAAAFERVAAEGSLAGTDIKGADLGFIARGQFHPLLDSVAFRLKEGEISRVIRSEEGLHVLMVKIILEADKKRPFDLIAEDLMAKLYEINSVGLLNEYTDSLRAKADISVMDSMADNKLEQERK
jgi:peptidyl-prolyl cis-trans isomerase C